MPGADHPFSLKNIDADRLEAERVASIFDRLAGVAIVNVLNAGLIAFVISSHGPRGSVLVWLTLVCALATARLLLLHVYRTDALRMERGRFWVAVSVATSLFSGVIWGLGPLLLASAQPVDFWLWSLAIGGMCAGAVSLHAAHLLTALSFTCPACLLYLVSVLANGTEDSLAIAALMLAFVAVTTNTARQFSRQFGANLSLRFVLERQTEALNRSNRQLSDEIEEHRKTSASLLQAQKMEALGKVTSGIAHDFSNLLTVILISLQSILRSSDDAKIRSSANLALEAASGGADLTDELLAFSRKEPLQPVTADLNGLIEQFRPLLEQAVERRATLDIDLTGRAVAVVDVARFQAALINLVVNARDAMDRPGRIMISTSLTLLNESEAGPMERGPGTFIKLDVMDTGSGMPPEVIARAFDPFFTTKEAGEGTGLGLSQVYSFARQAGGTARIRSTPGKGSCITLLIPAVEMEPVAVEARADARGASGAGRQVLLVDDNATILMMLRTALVEEGFEVRFAQEGHTALHILEHEPGFDLLITDITMPAGMNGLELARTVRARWPHLGVLLISGTMVVPEEAPAGVRFLAKPFRPHQFLDAVNAALAPEEAPTPRPGTGGGPLRLV